MKRFYLFYVLLILSVYAQTQSSVSDGECQTTYLGNCSFMYECDRKKVVIDPFGTEYGNYFILPSTETKEKIINGVAPFNDIDLLLITHFHGDHFDAKLTTEFLLNNPKVKMICPPQVSKQLKDSSLLFEKIERQIFSPQMSMNECLYHNANNISVQIIKMQHGTKRSLDGVAQSEYTDYEKTENYGYVINFEQKTIFHQGDACLKINEKALSTIKINIDITYLSYFDWDSTSLNIVKNKLKAQKVIFMHGTIPAKEFETEELTKIVSELTIFNKEMETAVF